MQNTEMMTEKPEDTEACRSPAVGVHAKPELRNLPAGFARLTVGVIAQGTAMCQSCTPPAPEK